MRVVEKYSLAPARRHAHRSVLVRDGIGLDVEIDGSALEAQFELDDGSALVLVTERSPHDEGLHVYLLGPSAVVEDAVEAGAAFTPGILKIIRHDDDQLDVQFFLDARVYRLEVRSNAAFRFRLPGGWRYKSRLSPHRLVVREAKEGDS